MSWHLLGLGVEAPAVAEVQGLYGPFSFSEILLQKVWLRGDFDRAALRTADGRRVQVRYPGRWNRLGGPDFTGARLVFDDGPEQIGDVELHLHAAGWTEHRHAYDTAYNAVILHVVLFPSERGATTPGAGGRSIPVAALLPLLHQDLEQFAEEDVIELLANRPGSVALEVLGQLAPDERVRLLRRHALERWQRKVQFARTRIAKLGWTEACHHAALEILGYRFNRVPMLRLATAHPLREWTRTDLDADARFASEVDWKLQGLRPANHPRRRLRQYAQWVRTQPDWPGSLDSLTRRLAYLSTDSGTSTVRRGHGLAALRASISTDICGGAIEGTRIDNLVCDGFLPLLSARSEADLSAAWFHWYPGDLPPEVPVTLRDLGVIDRRQPFTHGFGQGLLAWQWAREEQLSARR